MKFFNNYEEIKGKLIYKSIKNYCNQQNINFTTNQLNDITKLVEDNLNKETSDGLRESIYKSYLLDDTLSGYYVPEQLYKNIVDMYINELRSQQQQQDINQQQANLDNQRQALMNEQQMVKLASDLLQGFKNKGDNDEVDIDSVSVYPTNENSIITTEHQIYPFNDIIQDAILNYSGNPNLMSKLRQYYIDLLYYTGLASMPKNYLEKMNMYGKTKLASLFNQYRLSDEQVAAIIKEYGLPDIQTVVNASKYFIRRAPRKFNYKITKKEALKKINEDKNAQKVNFNISQSINNYGKRSKYRNNPIKSRADYDDEQLENI